LCNVSKRYIANSYEKEGWINTECSAWASEPQANVRL
jgi:hypothetical protein